MISLHILKITFLNEPELIFWPTVKGFHLFLSYRNTQLNIKTVLFQTIQLMWLVKSPPSHFIKQSKPPHV